MRTTIKLTHCMRYVSILTGLHSPFSFAFLLFISSDSAMDWRAISRSRSRISAMDWRPSSRSRSRPPPGQPFDQGNFSNSWSEGKFAPFPTFGDPSSLPGPAFTMSSKSFDTPYITPNEHATSSSIPIPGIATQLRYGTPPMSSSLQRSITRETH